MRPQRKLIESEKKNKNYVNRYESEHFQPVI